MNWISCDVELPPVGEYVMVFTRNKLNPDGAYVLVEWGGECWIETVGVPFEGVTDTRDDCTMILGDVPREEFSHWARLAPPEGC